MNTPVNVSQRLTPILDAFSNQFHKAPAGTHRVGSPLGAWCLLAFIAADEKNPAPEVLENLGCSTTEAKNILLRLLKEKPDAVALAVNSWLNPEVAGLQSFADWMSDVKEFNGTNIAIPAQAELDHWVDKESLGLISEFPVEIDPKIFLGLFATVIATDIKWKAPFRLLDDGEIGGAWNVKKVLHDESAYTTFIHNDETHGLFAVHEAKSTGDGLSVFSVIALDESVSEADTMTVARAVATGQTVKVDLRSLELGEHGSALEIQTKTSTNSNYQYSTRLPAWKTANEYDLTEAGLGFVESCERFNDIEHKAVFAQVAMAEYNAVGFKAAALTFGMVMRTAAVAKSYEVRKAIVKFNHPYAVVAVTGNGTGVWDAIPVFDGWITEAVEAEISE